MEKRTFYELLEAYRKTAIEQSKQTGTSMNDCGAALCGIDILDDLADELKIAAQAEAPHLCRTCNKHFAECKSAPTFASETDDRVTACNAYEPREKERVIWALITKYSPMSKLAVLYNTKSEADAQHRDNTTIVARVIWSEHEK